MSQPEKGLKTKEEEQNFKYECQRSQKLKRKIKILNMMSKPEKGLKKSKERSKF